MNHLFKTVDLEIEMLNSGLPWDLVANLLSPQYRGFGFDPWSGNYISHATVKILYSQKKKKKKNFIQATLSFKTRKNVSSN